MKITNNSNYPKTVGGAWIEPGETKEVEADISEDELSYHFTLEDDNSSETAEESEAEQVEEEEEVEDESEDKDDEEDSKSEKKNNNVGD